MSLFDILLLAKYSKLPTSEGFLLQKQSAAHFVGTNIVCPLVLLSLFIKLLEFSHSQDLPTLSYGAALPFHPLYFPNRMLPEGEEKMGRGINQSIVWFPIPLAPGHPVSWETRLGIESFCFEETKQNCVLSKFVQSDFLHTNKTIGDEGIAVDFWTIKVHTPN